jgi:uncharacterized membrane protein
MKNGLNQWFYEYFLKPIEAKTGYNLVNTTVYAVIAIAVLYLIYLWWKRERIRFSDLKEKVVPFVVFGSVKRVITDAVDAGILKGGIYNLYAYNVVNVSPGIYITIGILFILAYYVEKKWGIKATDIGWLLAGFHFLLLLPALRFWGFLIPVLFLALLPLPFVKPDYRFPIFSQALDGGATFFAVEFLGYGEQHVLTRFIGEHFGYIWFYILKVVLTYVVLKYTEKDEMKDLIWATVVVIGLAPGLRDLLRIIAGV